MLSFASSRIQITAALIIATGMWLIPSCSSDAPTTSAAPEEKVDYYDTKAVKRRYQTVNGHKQGKMIEYYNDGKVKAERNFKNDLEDGRTVYYFPSGNVREVQHFVAGEKQMGDTLWYDTGELQFTVDFKDSKKN
ncbi:MAG TPA: hypothetical protein PLW66_14290, partial [Saprospiraceae bacterium]|nr:hypothetical protein [Saprospiraceae bacterium]